MAGLIIERSELRQGVAALQTPAGTLLHDAHRWRLLLLPQGASPDRAQRWLEGNGLLADAPVPAARPRMSQLFQVRRDQAPSERVLLPEGARFGCVACGESCRRHALGPLVPSDVQRLRALDWSGTRHDPARFFVDWEGTIADEERLASGKDVLLRREGNGCQFLLPDNLCEVHARFGVEHKPAMCRLFPLLARATPDGVVFGLRLGDCASAERAVQGPPLAENTDELVSLWRELPSVSFVPPLLWLTDRALARWDEVRALAAAALARPPLGQGLELVWSLLDQVLLRAGAQLPEPAAQPALDELANALALKGSGVPGLHLAPAAISDAALRVEEQICRAAIFSQDALVHTDVASGVALLAATAHFARIGARVRAAARGERAAQPQHVNDAWESVPQQRVRAVLAERRVSALAVAAATRALPGRGAATTPPDQPTRPGQPAI